MMFRKNKMLLNIVIDFVMLTAMALVSISGFILEIVIPSRHAVKFQGALNVLTTHHIKVIRGCSGNILDIATDYLNGKLTDSGVGCSSHEHHHECHGHNHKE